MKTHEKPNDYTVSPRARQILRRSTVILASGSPRRRDLLAASGIRFRVVRPRVREDPVGDETVEGLARRLALTKARSVARSLRGGLVIGADTVVALDGRPYGKPADGAAARRMLGELSGRRHLVITALAVVDAATGRYRTAIARSRVRFRRLAPREVSAYVRTGEPMDKAGAYGIQGGAGRFVTEIEGSVSNIIGLPFPTLSRLVSRLGRSLGRGGPSNTRASQLPPAST